MAVLDLSAESKGKTLHERYEANEPRRSGPTPDFFHGIGIHWFCGGWSHCERNYYVSDDR